MSKIHVIVAIITLVLCAQAQGYQETKLSASDGLGGDNFGRSVAIDGDTIVVGAYKANNGNGSESGKAYVYTRNGSNWLETALSSNASAGNQYGYSVAIDSDTLAVGAPFGNAVYIYTRSGSVWSLQATLTVSGGGFGSSVGIEGDTLVAGAFTDDTNRGAAYIYTRSGSTWTQRKKLTAPVASSNNNVYFGRSAAISGDTVVVGAYQYTYSGKTYSGAAWVWTGSGSSWTLQGDLAALAGTDLTDGDFFGYSVDIDNDRVLVGAHNDGLGAAYMFVRSGSTWSQEGAKLTALNAATGGSRFGCSVSVLGDRALIGADYDHIESGREGSVHEFIRESGSWTEQSSLITASDKTSLDYFGCSVALAAEYAIVGSEMEDENGTDAGAAYVYNLLDDVDMEFPKVIHEFQINSYVQNEQQNPAIASSSQSNCSVVVWDSKGQDGEWQGVYGQRYDPNGIRIGEEFQVNTTVSGFQKSPDVAMDAEGNYIVVWEATDDSDFFDIIARLFNSDGMPLTGEILVNTYTDSIQDEPSVAMNDGGTFVVTWTSDREQPGHERSICARVFSSDGTPTTGEFIVSQSTTADDSDVCVDEDGDFSVVWNLKLLPANTWHNRFRQYHSNGTPKGNEVALNTSLIYATSSPNIIVKENGEMIAVWDRYPGNYENYSIRCQHFNSDGSKLGGEYVIDDGALSSYFPSVCILEEGKMFVTWMVKGSVSDWDVWAREYGTDGNPICDQFCMNTFIAGDQMMPQVASIGNRYFTVWQSEDQDGADTGVYGGLGPRTFLADFTGDQCVGSDDLALLLSRWLMDEPVLDISPGDNDGKISLSDFAVIADQWRGAHY